MSCSHIPPSLTHTYTHTHTHTHTQNPDDDDDGVETEIDCEALLEKLQTVTEIFDQKNDEYKEMEEKYDQCRKVS